MLATGKHVVVIGGGDTGSDCVGTSNRHGAKSVTQFELLPQPPEKENKPLVWPYWPIKLRTSSSHEEGCERDWSVATKRFEGKNGKVEKLIAVRVEWKDGKMQEVPGSEFEMKADLVLLAMGFTQPVSAGARCVRRRQGRARQCARGDRGREGLLHVGRKVFTAGECGADSRWWCGRFVKAGSARARSTLSSMGSSELPR